MNRYTNRYGINLGAFISPGKMSKVSAEENFKLFVSQWRCCWQLGIAIAFGIGGAVICGSDRVLTQSNIVPDGTLENENSVVINNFLDPNEVITGGATRGTNLFHSFQEFNVSEGRGAYFFSPSADIQNILARVTGSNRSEILGTLGTFQNIGGNPAPSNATLFLINPNGILFGQKASLNLGGSFVATTANAVGFGNQGFFSASVPNAPQLLTVNPSAFLFNQLAAASIKNNSIASAGQTPSGANLSGLRVPDGRSLLLIGGDVILDQGKLSVLGGRVELGGLAEAGTVGLTVDGNNLSLNFPVSVARANVSLVNGAGVFVSARGGGSIAVNAKDLELLGGSLLASGIGIGQGNVGARAGDITINATGVVTISDLSGIANLGLFNSMGDSGDIKITAQALNMTNAAQINTGTVGQGNGGSVFIQTQDTVSLSGRGTNGNPSGILSSVASPLFGVVSNNRGGDINIQTLSLFLSDGALVTSRTVGGGQAGNIKVNASDSISMTGSAALKTDTSGQGGAGDLTLTTGWLSVQDGSQVSTSTFGQGNAGELRVRASESVLLIGTSSDGQLRSALSTETDGAGDGGDLKIVTGRLTVQNGAIVSAGTTPNSTGKGGTLDVSATDAVELIGTSTDGQFRSALSTETNGTGDGGDLKIITGQLFVQNGAIISAESILGEGRGGKLSVSASDSVELIGTTANGQFPSVFSTETQGGDKPAGDLTINTGRLRIRDGALVTTRTFGAGKGGTLAVNADDVELMGTAPDGKWISSLTTETQDSGVAGNLRITTGQLTVRDGAQVAVNSLGLNSGKAGDLDVTANSILLDNQGKLIAQTDAGDGGNITLNVQDLLLMRHNSEISTSAGTAQKGGDGGNIKINAPFIVAVPKENSDITANAYTGRGGNINITTQGIYGLQFRPRRTPKNDITASSEFGVNGTVLINSAFDVTQSVTSLPIDLVDASNQIDQTCIPAGSKERRNNRFIITGRGGIPLGPNEPLQGESIITTNWVTLDSQPENHSEDSTSTKPDSSAPLANTSPTKPALVEAQGWVYGANGQVILTAVAPTATPHSPALTPATCQSQQEK